MPCGYEIPLDESPTFEVIVRATELTTLHEALFDPEDAGSQIFGAGDGNGFLDPDVFTAPDGTETAISRID